MSIVGKFRQNLPQILPGGKIDNRPASKGMIWVQNAVPVLFSFAIGKERRLQGILLIITWQDRMLWTF